MAPQAGPELELTCWAALVAGSGSLQTTHQMCALCPSGDSPTCKDGTCCLLQLISTQPALTLHHAPP